MAEAVDAARKNARDRMECGLASNRVDVSFATYRQAGKRPRKQQPCLETASCQGVHETKIIYIDISPDSKSHVTIKSTEVVMIVTLNLPRA